jgi:hypothetical protein
MAMATTKDTSQEVAAAQADMGLRKRTEDAAGAMRRSQLASIELATGMAVAIAEGWKTFRNHVNESSSLFGSTLAGSVEAAATFFEGVAGATRRSYETFERMRTAPPAAIDYDRLAKLVAAELRTAGKP